MGVRHALSVVAELATKDVTAVAMAVGKWFRVGHTVVELCDQCTIYLMMEIYTQVSFICRIFHSLLWCLRDRVALHQGHV